MAGRLPLAGADVLVLNLKPGALDRLTGADLAFASVNDMTTLSGNKHLRRIAIDTPNGPVSYPVPAPIVRREERTYGPVLGLEA